MPLTFKRSKKLSKKENFPEVMLVPEEEGKRKKKGFQRGAPPREGVPPREEVEMKGAAVPTKKRELKRYIPPKKKPHEIPKAAHFVTKKEEKNR